MSIVVKGAKLPNNCGACPLRLAWCTERLYMVTRPERCPLEPERTGKWIDCNNSEHWKCSECGYRGPYSWDDQHGFEEWLSDYCPNCGARMEP